MYKSTIVNMNYIRVILLILTWRAVGPLVSPPSLYARYSTTLLEITLEEMKDEKHSTLEQTL